MRTPALVLLAISLALGAACEGPMGPPGPGFSLGPDGSTPLDGGADAAAPDESALDAGAPPDAEPGTLSGHVRDPSQAVVARGRVVLVPRERVASLAARPLDLTLSGVAAALADNDEPLEDALAAPDLPSAQVAADGRYRFAQVPDGSFFVVYVPSADDDAHLPGGQVAHTPIDAASLRGVVLDLSVSGVPSDRARYVGSSSCIGCHARHGSLASGHALTLRVPGVSTPLQDVSAAPRIDEALAWFARGAELAFFDCDPARAPAPTCRVGESAPSGADVRLRLRLGRDDTVAAEQPGRYFVELIGAGGDRQRHPVALTLGGARTAQQYVARVALPDGGFTHFVLPITRQLAGSDARPDDRDKPWVAYRVEDWLDPTQGRVRTPPHDQSFERQCAGCHVTGFSARGSSATGFRASAVAERDGIYDLDGDGRKELLAVGCEACHGPGSEHLEVTPRGQRIVSPRLLTPERQSLVCGTCHARHQGAGGELAPLDAMLRMPRAGLARRDFLAAYVSRIESGPEVVFGTGDPRVGFQQYGDFVRSAKYRSPALLVTCTDCHDPHRSERHASDLREASASASCAGCHVESRDVSAHAQATVGYAHVRGVDQAQLTCTACHMVPTGASGARVEALVDVSSGAPFTYVHGDRTSHRFGYVDRSHAGAQPVAATRACAYCHGELLP